MSTRAATFNNFSLSPAVSSNPAQMQDPILSGQASRKATLNTTGVLSQIQHTNLPPVLSAEKVSYRQSTNDNLFAPSPVRPIAIAPVLDFEEQSVVAEDDSLAILRMEERSLHMLAAGQEMFDRKDYPCAIEIFREALLNRHYVSDMTNARLCGGLGTVMMETGQFEQAISEFTEGLRYHHATVQCQVNLWADIGIARIRLKQFNAAIKPFEMALWSSEIPGDTRARWCNFLGECHIKCGRVAEGISIIDHGRKSSGISPEIRAQLLNRIVSLYLQLHLPLEARTYLQMAIADKDKISSVTNFGAQVLGLHTTVQLRQMSPIPAPSIYQFAVSSPVPLYM